MSEDVILPGSGLQGFDPLEERADMGPDDKKIFEEASRRIVVNVLKSYTGYFDVFSELIQNALDAVDTARRENVGYEGRVWIEIDIPRKTVTVIDNGIGMNETQLRYCFRPSVSFKSRKESRGHKGVGATFLAYGFTNIQVHTKQKGKTIAVQLSNGRSWAEDLSGSQRRPKLEVLNADSEILEQSESGTKVEIVIGQNHRPDLTWWGAQDANQWLDMLCMRTPLGGVYLGGAIPPRVMIDIKVVSNSGASTTASTDRAEYKYPHELSVLNKVKSVAELQKETSKAEADISRLPADCRNLSAVYEIWDHKVLLGEANGYWDKVFDEEEQQLIRRHEVAAYGCFLSSAKSWRTYQEQILKVRASPALMRGGMQIASDFMVQGDLGVIPLTSTIGYQANTHIVIHFRDGNPDMGRKVFQPEIKALSEKISRQSVSIFKRFLHLMREDTGEPTIPESTDLWHWKQDQVDHRKQNPLEFACGSFSLAYVSQPKCEQDVVAIFHELVGMGHFPGMKFLATSEISRYDSCFVTQYDSEKFTFERTARPLGVSARSIAKRESAPFVLEFKYDFDGLVFDIEKEEKFLKDINFVVCWKIGGAYSANYRLISLLVGDEGDIRSVYGSTHALFSNGEKRLEILCLSDYFEYHRAPEFVEARHAQAYRD